MRIIQHLAPAAIVIAACVMSAAAPARATDISGPQTRETAIITEDFEKGMENWWIEGGEKVWIKDGRLWVDADPPPSKQGGRVGCTVWHKTAIAGDYQLDYEAHVVSSSVDANNVNLMLCFGDPSGQPLIDTRERRDSGAYQPYHNLNGYIITFLKGAQADVPNRPMNEDGIPKARIRFRRCPGFNLAKETWAGTCEKGRTYHITVTHRSGQFKFSVDGEVLLQAIDSRPHQTGLFGLRTFRTVLWFDNVTVKSLDSDQTERRDGQVQQQGARQSFNEVQAASYDRIVDYAVERSADWLQGVDPATGKVLIDGRYSTMHHCICAVFYGLYTFDHPRNTCYGKREYLEAAWKSAEYFLRLMDDQGKVVLVKIDGSKWPANHDTWTNYGITEIYTRTKHQMEETRRAFWDAKMALVRKAGESHAARPGATGYNHVAWRMLTTYLAARDRDDPVETKKHADYFARLASWQKPDGWWIEDTGPVMIYNQLYVQPLGVYYLLSGDERVVPALVRAAQYHAHFCYPDGTLSALISGRIAYRPIRCFWGLPGIDLAVTGEHYLRNWTDGTAPYTELAHNAFASLAVALLYGQKALSAPPLGEPEPDWLPRQLAARRVTLGPWELCLSALTGRSRNRWLTDRSVHLSVWHPNCGLICGGTKSTGDPRWANVTFGTEADDYCAASAWIGLLNKMPSIDLAFTRERTASIRVAAITDETLTIEFENTSKQDAAGQLPLSFKYPDPIAGKNGVLQHPGGRSTQTWTADDLGGEIHHRAMRIALPSGATLTWPYDVHNPYHPDGKLWEYASPNRHFSDRYREQYGLLSFPLKAGAKVCVLFATRAAAP